MNAILCTNLVKEDSLIDICIENDKKIAKINGTSLACFTGPESGNANEKIDLDLCISKSIFKNICRIIASSASGLKLLLLSLIHI